MNRISISINEAMCVKSIVILLSRPYCEISCVRCDSRTDRNESGFLHVLYYREVSKTVIGFEIRDLERGIR